MRKKKLTRLYALFVVFVLCLFSTVAGPGSSDIKNHMSKLYDEGTIDQYLNEMHGSVFYVGGSGPGNYSTIRSAMDAASDGDTIVVYPGIYDEDLIIKKSLHFIGRNKKTTIIDPENSPYTLSMDADNVTLQGFTIKNTNNHASGISIRASGVIIHNTIIDCASYLNKGMYLRNTNNTTLYDNSLINGGIYLENSYHNTIFNNRVNGQPLVYLENQHNIPIERAAGQVILVNCSNITVRNAHLNNLFCGMQIVNCHTCLIEENLFDNYLKHAIELTSSKHITLFNNTCKDGDFNLFCSTNIHVINNEMT
ncbi:MAG: right-handed parallel beta-helix repeat-containing protein, partial [Candidatus Thermoplasmatota archaeon]|nr:right-handed parallel beta-helix repeat-containing protein [Candidatus Thermoplasmatota archaeon]